MAPAAAHQREALIPQRQSEDGSTVTAGRATSPAPATQPDAYGELPGGPVPPNVIASERSSATSTVSNILGPARPAPQHPLGPQVSADAAPALDPRRPAPGHAAAPATLYPPPSDAQPVLQPTNSDGCAIPPPDPHAHYPSTYQQPYHAPQPHAPPTQVASPRTASPRLATSPTAAAAGAGGAPPALYSDSMCRARSGSVSGGGGGGCAAPECRICLLSESPHDLVSPCHCTGSLAYAHMACLRSWVIEKRSIHCELCGTPYKEPYGSELAAAIPPAPPPPVARRYTTPDGQPIIIMPMGVGVDQLLPPGAGGGAGGRGDVEPPSSLCEWRNMWSYGLILLLLMFAIIYVTVISKRGKQEAWLMTLWQVLLVVLPIYLVLRVAFDLYRHRLSQQMAAANIQAMAIANAAGEGGHREVIITRAGNRIVVLQRQGL